MFEHHRKSTWFVEKYDPAPEYLNLRARTRKIGWKGRESTFLHAVEAGEFDPDLNEPVLETEPISPIKDHPTNGEIPLETNGTGIAATSPAEEPKTAGGDDDMQFNMDVEEEAGDHAGDHDTSRIEANGKASGKNDRFIRGEEVSVAPEGNQVMIRTIPPDIGRVKLEDVNTLNHFNNCTFADYALFRLVVNCLGFMHILLSATLFKSAISIALVGSGLRMTLIWSRSWLSCLRKRSFYYFLSVVTVILNQLLQIEGFKLHVVYNLRPFVNRVRYTPEVASKPDRMEKDLANAKILAGLLEEEAAEFA